MIYLNKNYRCFNFVNKFFLSLTPPKLHFHSIKPKILPQLYVLYDETIRLIKNCLVIDFH